MKTTIRKHTLLASQLLAGALFAGALPLSAHADSLGVHAGAAQWSQAYSGSFSSAGDSGSPSTIDVQEDLALKDSDGMMYWVAFEHPVPVLPNLRYERSELKTDGVSTVSHLTGINFGDDTFELGDELTTDFDLSHNDYVLYYEILDNWVNLDIGIDVKQFDGEIRLQANTEDEREKLDAPVPLLYIAAKFDLPLTGLSIGGQAAGMSAGGVTLTDYRINLAYEFSFGLGLEAGQRVMTIELDDDEEDINGDLEFDGSYVGATFHF